MYVIESQILPLLIIMFVCQGTMLIPHLSAEQPLV